MYNLPPVVLNDRKRLVLPQTELLQHVILITKVSTFYSPDAVITIDLQINVNWRK